MHKAYTPWYVIGLALTLILELAGAPAGVVAIPLVAVAIVELVAVFVRKGPDDSLSEHVGQAVRDKPGFIPTAIGLAVWLVWLPLKLFPATHNMTVNIYDMLDVDIGLLAMAIGVTITLIIHFVSDGELA